VARHPERNRDVLSPLKQARRTWRAARGRSYWHLQQGLGTHFVPGRLEGYCNDLTGKTAWRGPVDGRGLPLTPLTDGSLVLVPTTCLQFGLGMWDLRLGLANDHSRDAAAAAFLEVADWAAGAMDECGGLPIWAMLGMEAASPYSAMVQGEAVSLLTRAYALSSERRFLDAATEASKPLVLRVEEGGTLRRDGRDVFLEELPSLDEATILNGWCFALFGLYDLELVHPTDEVAEVLNASVDTLARQLPKFDRGFWSLYALQGQIASPFYHRLHIAQLEAITLAFPAAASEVSAVLRRFVEQGQSRLGKTHAVAVKAAQKLRQPSPVTFAE
jgi:heparosan-N-sulfate-glucuronate 5-epimerase